MHQDRKTMVPGFYKANGNIGPNEVILIIYYFSFILFKLKSNTKVNEVLRS